LLDGALKAEVEAKLKSSSLIGDSAEFRNLMAELKRDNGIMAFYRDMFDMARSNLQEAISIRDNDPAAHYFFGKVMKLTGRTEEDLRLAKESFYKATQADKHQQNYGSHLHLALMLARERQFDRKVVARELDTYVKSFTERRAFMGLVNAFPPNLDSIYEYMTVYGDPGWAPMDPKNLEQYRQFKAIAENEIPHAPSTPVPGSATEKPAITPAQPSNIEKVINSPGGAPVLRNPTGAASPGVTADRPARSRGGAKK
jgi:hypothetical protein